MEIECDHAKRDKALMERGPGFARSAEVFNGHHFTLDLRKNCGEDRYITAGTLDGRMVVLVWTPRGAARRIINMRKANAREQTRYHEKMG